MESRKSECGRGLSLVVAALLLSTSASSFGETIANAKTNLVVGGTNTFRPSPVQTNTYYFVTGRVTSAFMDSTNSTEIYIQDTSSGIRVKSVPGVFTLETNSAVFALGVEVSVIGKIGQTNGQRMIRPEVYSGNPFDTGVDFYISDTNLVPVTPEVVTISNILANGEDYEGRLVRVNGVLPSDTNTFLYKANTDLVVTDATASITIFVDRDTDIDGQLPPTNTYDVIGIVGQFSTNAIPSNGYEIITRFYSDFIQTVGTQAPSLPLATSATAVVNAPFRLDVVAQDRNAGDILTVTNTAAPAGTTFTFGNREGVATWTPGIAEINTTNLFVFELSDGSTIVTATCVVVVRPASGGPGYAWVNEFHYDNIGTDTNEFVELAGEAGINLTNYTLVLYNGGNGTTYYTTNLTGVIDDEGNGYGAVMISSPASGIQNGSPDGIALINNSNGVLQFLSYEGTMIANNGPAAGIASIDVGVTEEFPVPAAGVSLQLQGNGTNYEAFAWTAPATATPGEINGCGQIMVGPASAKVTLSGLTLNPATPATNQAFYIDVLAAANCSASNLAMTAYYSLNGGSTSSIAMTFVGTNTYRSSSQVAGQTNGTIVAYFAGATFTGPGTNSPTYTPMNTYTVVVNVPVLGAIGNKSVTESNLLTFAVTATELDGNAVTLSVSNLPAGATFSSTNLNGSFSWPTPTPDGVYTLTFYAVDIDGFDFETITITVVPTTANTNCGLIISEYIEGSSNNKALELYNGTGSPIDLTNDQYVIMGYNNGAVFTNVTYIWGLTGIVAVGGTHIVASSAASNEFTNVAQQVFGGVNWNGDDAIVLRSGGTNGPIVDSFGQVGFDPGTAWGPSTTNDTLDNTLRRKFGISGGDANATDTFDPTIEWDFFTNNTSSGLTTHTNTCSPSGVDPDDDDDLLPNTWESQYFGDNTSGVATADGDLDGFDNLSEFISFTDPTNSASYFKVDAISSATNSVVTILSATGRNYRIDYIVNLLDGTAWTNLQSGIPGTGSPLSITDTNASVFRNYRIGVQLQ